LIANELFEDRGRRRPVDPAQHEKAAIEPRAEEMMEIAVDHRKAAVLAHAFEEVRTQGDERRRTARRAIEAAEELLPAGLAGVVDLARRGFVAGRRPASDRILHALRIGPKSVRQRAEEQGSVGVGKRAVARENLARERKARGFAA